MSLPVNTLDGAMTDPQQRASSLMNDLRSVMESEVVGRRAAFERYLHCYSPPYNDHLGAHDMWREAIRPEDIDTTRSTFPLARAVVDIWTSLEAGNPPTIRAEAERIAPLLPQLDQAEALKQRLEYDSRRQVESLKSDIRSARVRRSMRADGFALKHHSAVRRKNLYGQSWMKVLPRPWEERAESHVLRNPASVYPLWSTRDPGDLEAIFSAQQMSARQANARWSLGLRFRKDGMQVEFERGADSGRYQDINNRMFDSSRTMVWVEELWWVDREYGDDGKVTRSCLYMALRVLDRIVKQQKWEGMMDVPFVLWENADERADGGWSDIAAVIDINDEFNRRISQQGDIIRIAASPRYQLLGSVDARKVEMPAGHEILPLFDGERIEQILSRIDVFPAQAHFDILTDMLHRATGLPPIVWGLIQNAQTSGRALTASWKATEARLMPKLMRNEMSVRRYVDINLQWARYYDWHGANTVFGTWDKPFRDFDVKFPPMEPRDFQEVTLNEITKRDAGLTTTVKAMRATGDEAAEETWEEVQAEFMNVFAHPDKVNTFLLAQRAGLDNQQMAAQLGQGPAAQGGPVNTATIAGGMQDASAAQAAAPPQAALPPGMEGGMPPTQQGAPANAGAPMAAPGGQEPSQLTSGLLVRNGEPSAQFLETRRW